MCVSPHLVLRLAGQRPGEADLLDGRGDRGQATAGGQRGLEAGLRAVKDPGKGSGKKAVRN